MKKSAFLFFGVLLLSLTAQGDSQVGGRLVEQSIRFTYSSAYSMYHCDYAVRQTKKVLEALGAQDVRVRCNGGLPYDSVNFISAKFKSVQVVPTKEATQDLKKVSLRLAFKESCDFNETIVDRLLKGFEVSKVKKSSTCWRSQGRVQYNLTVLQ